LCSILFVDDLKNYPCFWEMVVNNVFIFLCMNYLDIVHLIIHITLHFYTLHFYFLLVACKCLGWFSYSWQNIILAKK